MLQLSRRIGVAVLLCGAVACGRGEKESAAPPPEPPPPVQQPASVPEAPKPPGPTRTVTRDPVVPEGPAAPVLINGVLTNGDAAILADFQKRIADYVTLKKGVDKKTPDQKETHDPIQIETTQKLLAAKIMNVRSSAHRGDIFTPHIQTKFRQLLRPEVKGTTGAETKQEIDEEFEEHEAENQRGPLKVNSEYPEGSPLATTPPNVLRALPRLPQGLEYRFVERTLLIRDVDSNLVVDMMPNAIR